MTTSQITTTRQKTGSTLDGMTWEVDDLLVASIRRGRLNVNGMCRWTVRLYTGPEEYDIYQATNLIDAQNLAYEHAKGF